MGGVLVVVYLAVIVLTIAGMWKVYVKAGEPGWAAIIPIYSTYVLLKIVGRPWWWLLLMLIPIVGFVVYCIAANDLAKSFGKGPGFTVGLVLLPFVFFPMLGFGADLYRGPGAQMPSL